MLTCTVWTVCVPPPLLLSPPTSRSNVLLHILRQSVRYNLPLMLSLRIKAVSTITCTFVCQSLAFRQVFQLDFVTWESSSTVRGGSAAVTCTPTRWRASRARHKMAFLCCSHSSITATNKRFDEKVRARDRHGVHVTGVHVTGEAVKVSGGFRPTDKGTSFAQRLRQHTLLSQFSRTHTQQLGGVKCVWRVGERHLSKVFTRHTSLT